MIKPSHVRLLDYELEIGLVCSRPMPVGSTVTADTLADYVAGLVVTNDISARDIQLPKGQYFESKSYPTFTQRTVVRYADEQPPAAASHTVATSASAPT